MHKQTLVIPICRVCESQNISIESSSVHYDVKESHWIIAIINGKCDDCGESFSEYAPSSIDKVQNLGVKEIVVKNMKINEGHFFDWTYDELKICEDCSNVAYDNGFIRSTEQIEIMVDHGNGIDEVYGSKLEGHICFSKENPSANIQCDCACNQGQVNNG